ncbi:hypothetical protein ACMBCN_03420, partial [Candidatus Liberibacter asiaticus]|nr:hypothetical protein [Candidatus Liberibacter asiaticus]
RRFLKLTPANQPTDESCNWTVVKEFSSAELVDSLIKTNNNEPGTTTRKLIIRFLFFFFFFFFFFFSTNFRCCCCLWWWWRWLWCYTKSGALPSL